MSDDFDSDCPPDIVTVTRNKDDVDEVFAKECDIHVERMDDDAFWMAIYKGEYTQFVWFNIVDGKLVVSSECADWPEAADRRVKIDASAKIGGLARQAGEKFVSDLVAGKVMKFNPEGGAPTFIEPPKKPEGNS